MRKRVACLAYLLVFVASAFGQNGPIEIGLAVKAPFKFVAYGDTRFTDPNNHDAANAEVRQALVKAIADAQPTFVSLGGDLVYNGYNRDDWNTWDTETAEWREKKIPVYPALGNHDLHGNLQQALGNYFARFPDLQKSRYYSVRAANTLMLVLDSSEEETAGKQGEWLKQKLDSVPADVAFVFVVLHHPPYTNSSDREILRGGGHSARGSERNLAKILESRQANMHAKVIVFAGHVHNYERHEHNGVMYFVTGGGGAHPYHISRAKDDPLRDFDVNYHYLLVEVKTDAVKITMNRLEMVDGKPRFTQPDTVTINLAK